MAPGRRGEDGNHEKARGEVPPVRQTGRDERRPAWVVPVPPFSYESKKRLPGGEAATTRQRDSVKRWDSWHGVKEGIYVREFADSLSINVRKNKTSGA